MNEIACCKKENMMKAVEMLVDEGYVVMISREEELWIVNYEYGSFNDGDFSNRMHSDRNAVVFMSKERFESNYMEVDLLGSRMDGGSDDV